MKTNQRGQKKPKWKRYAMAENILQQSSPSDLEPAYREKHSQSKHSHFQIRKASDMMH